MYEYRIKIITSNEVWSMANKSLWLDQKNIRFMLSDGSFMRNLFYPNSVTVSRYELINEEESIGKYHTRGKVNQYGCKDLLSFQIKRPNMDH